MSAALWCFAFAASLALLAIVLLLLVLLQGRRIGKRVSAVGARIENAETQLRALRLQVSNVVKMLLNAGFKVRKSFDWNDNEDDTRPLEAASPYDTQVDLRKP